MEKRKKLDEYIAEAERALMEEIAEAEKEKLEKMEVKKREQTELQKNVVAEYLEELEIQKMVLAGMQGVHTEQISDNKKNVSVTEEQVRRQKEAQEIRDRAKKAKERTRRLIQEGAILETIFPELKDKELEQVRAVLIKIRESLSGRSV